MKPKLSLKSIVKKHLPNSQRHPNVVSHLPWAQGCTEPHRILAMLLEDVLRQLPLICKTTRSDGGVESDVPVVAVHGKTLASHHMVQFTSAYL